MKLILLILMYVARRGGTGIKRRVKRRNAGIRWRGRKVDEDGGSCI